MPDKPTLPTTTITAIHRFGSRYLVSLECGHKVTLTADELVERQWFIGRRVQCEETHELPNLPDND